MSRVRTFTRLGITLYTLRSTQLVTVAVDTVDPFPVPLAVDARTPQRDEEMRKTKEGNNVIAEAGP